MKKKIICFLTIILVLYISFYFYHIKWLGYERIPDTTIFDERDYPFVGYTFKKTGIPTGWSTMDIYKSLDDLKEEKKGFNNISITVDDQEPTLKNISKFNYPITYVTDVDIGKGIETIRLVQPFLDHPFFGTFILSLGIKSPVTSFDSLKPEEYRKTALYLSVITGILIFILSYIIYNNYLVSLFSLILYSSIPTFVLMSRFALLENILIPLSLLVFIFVILFIKRKSTKTFSLFLFLAGIFSGLAFITKESGIFIFFAVFIYLIKNKIPLKKYLNFLIPFVFISIAYYAYMYYLSPNLFFKLLFDQANRGFYGPLSFFSSMIGPNFKNFPKEAYWIFGLISLFTISYKNFEKHFYLFTAFSCYLFIYLFLGGLNYPWYSIVFIPFLVISSGYFIHQLLVKPDIVSLVIFYLLPFSSSFYWGYFTYKTNTSNYSIYRFSLLSFIILFIIQKYFNKNIKIFNHNIKVGYSVWAIVMFFIFYQINTWNLQGFQYIIANWGNLPERFTILDKIL